MKNVIYFDGWTLGASKFTRLDKYFKDRGFKSKLIHFGSYGHDRYRPKSEKIGNIDVHDISYYSRLKISDILIKEKPSIIVFLSLESILHKSIAKFAKSNGIRVILLSHGVYTAQDIEKNSKTEKRSLYGIVKLAYQRIRKNVLINIPISFILLYKINSPLMEYLLIFKELYFKLIGRANYFLNDAFFPDIIFVMCRQDISAILSLRPLYSLSKFINFGLSDLIPFNNSFEHMINKSVNIKNNSIIYIDAGYYASGALVNSFTSYLNHLEATSRHLQSLGYELFVKFHPAHISLISKILFNPKYSFKILDFEQFINLMPDSYCIISEPSTLATSGIFFRRPIFGVSWGLFKGVTYGELLTNYPLFNCLYSIDNLNKIMEINNSVPKNILDPWILEFISSNRPINDEELQLKLDEII